MNCKNTHMVTHGRQLNIYAKFHKLIICDDTGQHYNSGNSDVSAPYRPLSLEETDDIADYFYPC